jgi:carbonic anhydrase
MRLLNKLFENNRKWAKSMSARNPEFFPNLAKQQSPKHFWIGCSDSRVPANEIVGFEPGQMFVHRNIANLVVHSDMNCLSVLQYAVEILEVEHVIVCGHYGCGGIKAAMAARQLGLLDNWLRHVKDVYDLNREQLEAIYDPQQREDLLCELNVREQVFNVCHTTIIQNAWSAGRSLAVHGWIYQLHTGLLRDLGVCLDSANQLETVYRMQHSLSSAREKK